IAIEEGDTDTAPYGLGTYASRSTPVAGAAAAMAARKGRDKAKKIAAHLLEASEEDLVWEGGKVSDKRSPGKSKTIQDCAFAAYTNHPQGMEAGLEGGSYYDPPNLTSPLARALWAVHPLRPPHPHLPVRQLHLRGGHRQRHRRGQGPPLRGHRRLRQHHQPDD